MAYLDSPESNEKLEDGPDWPYPEAPAGFATTAEVAEAA